MMSQKRKREEEVGEKRPLEKGSSDEPSKSSSDPPSPESSDDLGFVIKRIPSKRLRKMSENDIAEYYFEQMEPMKDFTRKRSTCAKR